MDTSSHCTGFSEMNKALIFNCHYNGLAIIQELGRNGVPVLALDHVRSVGTFSRYASYHRCPDPQVTEDAFVTYLMHLGPEFKHRPVLFPTNDHWAMAISRHKEKLSEYYLPCVAEYPTIRLILEKQRFYEWALTRGYPVPRSWRSVDAAAIPEDAFPLAAKPEHRRIASNDAETGRRAHTLDEMRLTVLRTREELTDFAIQHDELLPYFLFQEYIEGLSDCMYTVGVYANSQHEVLGLFTGRKVRGFPPDVGDCIVGQVESVPAELKTLAKEICQEIKYQGIAEFEFKRDAVTGEFKLIEINPRSWSWVGITPSCGVSLPWIAYCDITGLQPISYTESGFADGSVKWVRIFDDMLNSFYKNRRIGYPQWHMTPRQWWRSLRSERLVIAEFSLDDPIPGLYAVFATASTVLRKLFR
jgi:D-aspartate ligase